MAAPSVVQPDVIRSSSEASSTEASSQSEEAGSDNDNLEALAVLEKHINEDDEDEELHGAPVAHNEVTMVRHIFKDDRHIKMLCGRRLGANIKVGGSAMFPYCEKCLYCYKLRTLRSGRRGGEAGALASTV